MGKDGYPKTWLRVGKGKDTPEPREMTRETDYHIYWRDDRGRERSEAKGPNNSVGWYSTEDEALAVIHGRAENAAAKNADKLVRDAAWDLLGALELLLSSAHDYQTGISEARAAIAKARGQ